MSDPISGAGGGAAKLALQEMMKQQQQQQIQNPASGQQTGGVSFQSKMDNIQQPQQVSEVQKSHEITKSRSIREMAGINSGQGINPSQKAQSSQFGKVGGQDSFTKGIGKFMKGMNAKKESVDSLIKQALQGKKFNNKELLVLQYKLSTYSMEMNLTSKVVEKATSGIKQAMQTQV